MSELLLSPDLAFLRDEAIGRQRVRAEQSLNAPRATYYQQGIIDATTVHRINSDELRMNAVIFSFMVLVLDKSAGDGRYMINGDLPTAAGHGIQLAGGNGAGTTVLTLTGQENMRSFRIIAETGNLLPYALQLFR